MKGPEARKLHDELNEKHNERKRDKKDRLKQQVKEMDQKKKFGFRIELARKLEDEYILTCQRFPLDPADFLKYQL